MTMEGCFSSKMMQTDSWWKILLFLCIKLWFSSRSEPNQTGQFPAASAREGIILHYPRTHSVGWGPFPVSVLEGEMPSNPMEDRKNWQDETAVIFNKQRIRGNWFGPQQQSMSSVCSLLHKEYPTITLYLSAFHPSSRNQPYLHFTKKPFTYPVCISFLLQEGLMFLHRVTYNPGIAFINSRIWILTPRHYGWGQLISPLHVPPFFHL